MKYLIQVLRCVCALSVLALVVFQIHLFLFFHLLLKLCLIICKFFFLVILIFVNIFESLVKIQRMLAWLIVYWDHWRSAFCDFNLLSLILLNIFHISITVCVVIFLINTWVQVWNIIHRSWFLDYWIHLLDLGRSSMVDLWLDGR